MEKEEKGEKGRLGEKEGKLVIP